LLNSRCHVFAVVDLAGYERVEVLPEDGVVSLGFVEDLLANLSVEILEECKDLPKR